jgi:hypothetical protein
VLAVVVYHVDVLRDVSRWFVSAYYVLSEHKVPAGGATIVTESGRMCVMHQWQ